MGFWDLGIFSKAPSGRRGVKREVVGNMCTPKFKLLQACVICTFPGAWVTVMAPGQLPLSYHYITQQNDLLGAA